MRINNLRIENFRGFKDETVSLDRYCCFVGANGAGKSTVLAALNVFFRQYRDSKTDLSKLSVEDFHHKNVDQPIRITVTFTDLSEQASKDLADYARQHTLIVSAVARYDPGSQRAEVKQYGSRLGMTEFVEYFEAEKAGASAKDLQGIYESLARNFGLPPAKVKQVMADNLRAFEGSSSKATPIPSEDQFYGATRGANRLAPHVQWIFVPAAKDITEEGNESKASALGQLLSRTIRTKVDFQKRLGDLRVVVGASYQEMLDAEQSVLDQLSVSIELRLKSWAHPAVTAKVLWKQDPDKSVRVEEPWAYIRIGERGFESELARFGHGMQRSCMLTLLQELASGEPGAEVPTLIMGIEEPELCQHPPQARYLAELLYDLSKCGSKIAVCSHSPLFIPGDHFDAVRVVRECGTPAASFVKSVTYEDLAKKLSDCGDTLYKEAGMLAKLYSTLNPAINEMFFCRVLILVESVEDIAYLVSGLALYDRLSDFRKHGCHIVPVGGKSELLKPVLLASLLSIPVFVVFDADTQEQHVDKMAKHRTDNGRLFKALGIDDASDWPEQNVWRSNCTAWSTEIGSVVKSEIGELWQECFQAACAQLSNPGNLHKNPLAIAKTLENAWHKGGISTSIGRLVTAVLAFAAAAS
jgi:putative ATP-dependent endonuclease of the OLD family